MTGEPRVTRRRIETATLAALACFYAVGLAAHLIELTRPLMATLTPFVLVVGGAVVLAQALRSARSPSRLLLWCLLTAGGTFAAEVVGVRTGAIFGSYSYGEVLGAKLLAVPPVIGFNWTLTLLGAILLAGLRRPLRASAPLRRSGIVLAGALGTGLLAVIFDLALEPTAVALRYWSWHGGAIPTRNYIAWFVLSALSALLYRALGVEVRTRLPIFYLALQWLFFLGIDAARIFSNL